MNKKYFKLIASVTLAIILGLVFANPAHAGYYGQDEEVNKRFTIEKWVRIEGDDTWEDKIVDVDEDDIVEFKIKVENKSDEDADSFDDMKIEDFLPDEMYRVGGTGLTEYWDDFDSDEDKTFIIKAKVDSDEYDRDVEFEKCIVNKVELYWDEEFEGSDTATVCYGNVEIEELPETGLFPIMAVAGVGLFITGYAKKKLDR